MSGRDKGSARGACRNTLTRVSIERRRACRWLLLPAAHLVLPRAWAEAGRIASARLWPAQGYTRVILESPAPVAYQLHTMKNPERLGLGPERVQISPRFGPLPSP